MNIVIADDSALLRDRIRLLLTSFENVKVVGEAVNGLEALHLINKVDPDLAILDIRMPGLNGIELLKKIRESGPRPKIFILTNYPYKQYRERCLAEGADYFFDKNQDIEELSAVISKMASQKTGV